MLNKDEWFAVSQDEDNELDEEDVRRAKLAVDPKWNITRFGSLRRVPNDEGEEQDKDVTMNATEITLAKVPKTLGLCRA